MRIVAATVLVGFGLLTGSLIAPAVGSAQSADAPLPATSFANGLVALAAPPANGIQQLTIVDPQSRAMAVYHVEMASGQVTLKSVRNLHWDLQLEDFNSTTPKASEVRIQIQGR